MREMHIILGATGHVGRAVATALLERGESATIVTHDPAKAEAWKAKGARAAVADVHDVEGLREVFRAGKRLFLLNPPAAPSTDTATEERRSLAAILAAIEGAGLEKIVAQSTYGAQPGDRVGDLGVLYEMEQGLDRLAIPHTVIRAAYYMSNWDAALETAREDGVVPTLYPPEFKLPMAAPEDLGRFAARFLTEPVAETGLRYVEGPETYSSADVAAAFGEVLGKSVKAVETTREEWVPTLRGMGFSTTAAESMAAMTEITLAQRYEAPDTPLRGATTLRDYIAGLAQRS